jgi:hypothetical protein
MGELFQNSISSINQHLKAVFEEGGLSPERTVKKCFIVLAEGA